MTHIFFPAVSVIHKRKGKFNNGKKMFRPTRRKMFPPSECPSKAIKLHKHQVTTKKKPNSLKYLNDKCIQTLSNLTAYNDIFPMQ